jgi:dipeptidase E
MVNALLLSNSTIPGTPFFTWPKPWVKEFLGKRAGRLLFVPYAAVTFSYDEYAEKVLEVFTDIGFTITSIHAFANKREAIAGAEGIIVGGGNTFALLSALYREDLLPEIRRRVTSGMPYVGWSAGANLACPTIMTTNDMPIVQPPSFDALALVPFQINPHYHELTFEGQGGETRRDRLEEFLAANPHRKVIGLPEGMLIRISGSKVTLEGSGVAKLYEAGKEVRSLNAGEDVSFLV